MKEKTLSSNQWAIWSSRILKAVCFCLVIATVIIVCRHQLNAMREQSGNLPAGYVSAAERTRQLDCLARNIYWEASGEPFEGKVAVAQVTMNRVDSGRFAQSICGVVYQKNILYEKVICQFSWVCEHTPRVSAIHKPQWDESEEVAKKVLLEGFRLPALKNALFFHGTYISPGWNREKIAVIGQHVFYK